MPKIVKSYKTKIQGEWKVTRKTASEFDNFKSMAREVCTAANLPIENFDYYNVVNVEMDGDFCEPAYGLLLRVDEGLVVAGFIVDFMDYKKNGLLTIDGYQAMIVMGKGNTRESLFETIKLYNLMLGDPNSSW